MEIIKRAVFLFSFFPPFESKDKCLWSREDINTEHFKITKRKIKSGWREGEKNKHWEWKSKKQDVSTRGARLARPRAWMKFEGANRFDNGFQPPLRNNNDLWGSCFGHTLILLVCILTYWIHHWRFISTHREGETEGADRKLLQSNSQEAPWEPNTKKDD